MEQKIKTFKNKINEFKGMRLLNPASMSHIVGGEEIDMADNSKTNLKCGITRVYLCAYEIHCSNKGFTYDCSLTKFSAGCGTGTNFTIGPAK